MLWHNCATVRKWQRSAASRLRSYSHGRDQGKNQNPILSLVHSGASETQKGRQGPWLYPPEPDCGARGHTFHPWNGQDGAASSAYCRVSCWLLVASSQ